MRLVARLKGHHAGALAPAVGERMPGFVLPDENGDIVRLGELLRQGPLVINFHRGHWCPYCRLALGQRGGDTGRSPGGWRAACRHRPGTGQLLQADEGHG